MAALAANGSMSISEFVRLLAPRPGRLEFAVRLALICALTVLVTEIYQTPEPALAAYIVFFLNRDSRTLSLILSVILTLLITVIIGIVILVAMLVLDDPMWRVISMALISFGLLFLASASKLRPLASTIALIIGYALDELGLIQVGELGTRALLYAWLFVGIPAGVSILVNFLLAPSPRRLAERAIALRLDLTAAMLRTADETVREKFHECLREGTHEILEWIGLADREKTSPAADIAALKSAAGSTIVLLSAADVMDRNPEATLPASLREYLAKTLDEMAVILKGDGYPTEIVWRPPEDDAYLSPLAAVVVGDMEDAIVHFAVPESHAAAAEFETGNAAAEKKKKAGFFSEDAFTNPEHVHYAVKTTVAAMFCYVLYSQLDWSGIHTCFLTCYIVSLNTAAESVEKLTLRILGCLVGAAMGYAAMIWLVPDLTSIGALMILVFIGALAAAYVAVGSPRISYVGFQMAFAFFLCVIQGPSPAFDLTIARDRVIGIMLGNVVAYFIFANIWPVSVVRRIDPGLVSLLRRLADLANATSRSRRNSLATEAAGTMITVSQDVELAAYESPGTGQPQFRLNARASLIEHIRALLGPLLLLSNAQSSATRLVAHRLDALANELSGGVQMVEVGAPPGENSPAGATGREPRESGTVEGFVM